MRRPAGAPKAGSRASVAGLLVSAVAVAGVVWWALRQEPPQLPSTSGELLALGGAIALYALATVVRAERWELLLSDVGAHAPRADVYALTVVGYAVNNVLPARAGDAVRVLLLAPRTTRAAAPSGHPAGRAPARRRGGGRPLPLRGLRAARRGGRRLPRADRPW